MPVITRATTRATARRAARPTPIKKPTPTKSTAKKSTTTTTTASPRTDASPSAAWQPPKTRKTSKERSISRPGDVITKTMKNSLSKSGEVTKVLNRGPDGLPVRDVLGYKLSYKKVLAATRPRSKPRLNPGSKKYEQMLKQEEDEERRRMEIMGVPKEKSLLGLADSIFQDQVAADLDIPFHTVDMAAFEEWHRRGFKIDPKRWQEPLTENERDRLYVLSVGSVFRE